MSRQTLQTVFFAATILAAHVHCVMLHAVESHAAALARDEVRVPVRPTSTSCENESGCICKGATLVVSAQVPALDLARPDASFVWWQPDLALGVLDRARCPDSPLPFRWPISAQTVRAWLQSYLL